MNIKSLVVFFLLILASNPAFAQDCTTAKETIIKLRQPTFGYSTIWEYLYSDDGYESFTQITPAHIRDDEKESFVLAGHYTHKDDETYRPLLVKMDVRGKIIWEKKRNNIKNQTIIKLLQTPDGYLTLSTIQKSKNSNGIALTFFTKDGSISREKQIFEKNKNIYATDISATQKGTSFIITGYIQGEKSEAFLYQVNSKGHLQWKRTYRPGLNNKFETIRPTFNHSYIVAGQIEQEDERNAGWLLEIDDKGSILWQRQLPRGKNASLHQVLPIKGTKAIPQAGYIALGKATPNDGSHKGVWVMQTDEIGNMQWQRYYQSDYQLNGQSLIRNQDKLIRILLSASPSSKKNKGLQRSYASLLTLSPRGRLMDVESYTADEGIYPLQMIEGKTGQLMIAGRVQKNSFDTVGDEFIPSLYDGWFFSTTASEPYEDPCTP